MCVFVCVGRMAVGRGGGHSASLREQKVLELTHRGRLETSQAGGWSCLQDRPPARGAHANSRRWSVAQSCPTLCHPADCSTPGFPALHYLRELAQTHFH